jgi:hypothetical protein
MKAGLGGIMKQAQRMKDELQKVQMRLVAEEITGESGGGMVSITMNGRHQVLRMKIDPNLLQDDRELLEDLIIAAINDAVNRIEEKMQAGVSEMKAMGWPLPPGVTLPF